MSAAEERWMGLLVPLDEELEAVKEVLEYQESIELDGHYYYLFRVPDSDIQVLAVALFAMGNTPAALSVQRLLRSFPLPLISVIGIAGALDRQLGLGDVVVASEIQQPLREARVEPSPDGAGYREHGASTGWRAPERFTRFARNFRHIDACRPRHDDWRERAASRMAREDERYTGPGPIGRVGPIASGDTVVGEESYRQLLLAGNRKLLAVEMEGAGVAEAAAEAECDVLVVRGISDYADERKSTLDQEGTGVGKPGYWRRHAARNAAGLLAAMVAAPEFPWPRSAEPWPGTAEREREHGQARPSSSRDDSGLVTGLLAGAVGGLVLRELPDGRDPAAHNGEGSGGGNAEAVPAVDGTDPAHTGPHGQHGARPPQQRRRPQTPDTPQDQDTDRNQRAASGDEDGLDAKGFYGWDISDGAGDSDGAGGSDGGAGAF